MRALTKLLYLLPLLYVTGSAAAEGNDMQDSFSHSFEASCVDSLVKKAIGDYSQMTRIAMESIPLNVRNSLEEITRPLHVTCKCVARKASVKVESKTQEKMEIAVDLKDLAIAKECAPERTTLMAVQRGFMKLIELSPPPVSFRKTKRVPFTVELTLNKARPSVFAAYTQPPDDLTKLVFLAPGTGAACESQNICVDKSPLEIVKANELLISHGRTLGEEGSRNLQRIIEEFGGDARVITSGSNFSNFSPTHVGVTYSIRSIDGVPVEKTTAKKIWLVFFASQVPVDSGAIDFSAAIVSVVEVEFAD